MKSGMAKAAGEASTAGGDAMAATGAMQTTDPSKAVWPVVEEVEVGSAGEVEIAFVAEPIAADEITATHDVDVVVCGLGPAGDAAALACAEQGLKVVAVEKQNRGNYNSATIGGTNSKLHEHWGMTYDTDAWIADAMVDNAFQGDMTLFKHFLEKNGEAVDWYISHFDNQNLDDYPLTFAAGDFPNFRDEWDKTALSRSWNTSLNLPYPPGELADILAGILTEAGVEIRFNTPACQLVTDDAGKVTGVIVKGEGGYEQYNCAKGVVLATGGYSHNEKMLGQYAPWILKNQDKFLFSYEVTDHDGNPADTGDGQQMGMNVGGHLDVGPHAVMAHILQFGQEFFLQVNEHGERFTNEDLSMTNIAKVMQNQPGSKVFQIIDSHWPEQYPMLEMVMENIRSYGDGEGFSAQADTLEELASQLELSADATQNLTAAVARYNELCEKGVDEDFGKAAEKMFPVVDPPFYAITYDMLKHTSVEDVSCMRLLVTMGGLVTDDNARVLNDDMEPIPGLFAVGNVQGGRFVEDYPFTLSGASHAAALTYGYLTGKYLAEQA